MCLNTAKHSLLSLDWFERDIDNGLVATSTFSGRPVMKSRPSKTSHRILSPCLMSLLIAFVLGGCAEENQAGNPLTPTTTTTNVQCPGGIVGDVNAPPEIRVVGLQSGANRVQGTANNVDASVVRVVLWAKTDIWYVQPFVNRPFTDICDDGSWDNSTHPWNRMVALLVSPSYQPDSTRGTHPSMDEGVLAWDEYPAQATDRTLDFSGYRWQVKNADLAGEVDPTFRTTC